jgi:hypothetical protein
MRWRRRRDESPESTNPSPQHVEAQKALSKAEEDLSETQTRNSEIIRVAQTAKAYGRRNNFTEMIAKALQGTGN